MTLDELFASSEAPSGSCPGCGHRWADHDERDGCGACALEFTRSCKRWPVELEGPR